MENLYSVRIIRREDQAVASEYIKQFWMFCGVYVREFIMEYAEEIKDDQKVDCNIFLTEDIKEQNLLKHLQAKKEIYINLDGQCDLSSKKKRENFGKELENLLLGKLVELEDDIYEVYDAFVKYDIAYINYISHLYLYQFDIVDIEKGNINEIQKNNQKEKYIKVYKKCLENLYKSGEEFTGGIYKKFAYLNCGRKVNRISKANKQPVFFDVSSMMWEAHKLSMKDNLFSMGDVLAGLIGLTEYGTDREAESYLYSAIRSEKGQKHSAFIYYCLGHYYEMERHEWAMGWQQYKKMVNIVDSCNYRFNFKCGCKEFREGNYENAWNIFTNIYNSMKIREQRGWIQPLEMEYYYKCAKVLNQIPISQKFFDVFTSEIEIPSDYQTYDILENCMKKSKFVDDFIGTHYKNQIQKYYRNKMESHTINRILGQYY